MTNKLCTETFNLKNPDSLKTYLDKQGYQAWKNIITEQTPKSKIIEKIRESGLRGKGGAGFLTGLSFL